MYIAQPYSSRRPRVITTSRPNMAKRRSAVVYKKSAIAPAKRRYSAMVKTTNNRALAARAVYSLYKIAKRRKYRLASTVPRGTGSTFSSYSMMFKKGTRATFALLKNNQTYRQSTTSSVRLSVSFGKQNVSTMPGFYGSAVYSQDYALVNNGSGANLNTSKLFYKETVSRMTFTNQEISTCYVQIYQLEPRFHLPNPGGITFYPDQLWYTGLINQESIAGFDYTDVYQRPFSSQMFCLHWKVNKMIQFELQQGQSHSHVAKYYHNTSVYGALTYNFNFIRGMSQTQMVVISGTPLNDANTPTLVSTSKVAVDIVQQIDRVFTKPAQITTIRNVVNSLPNITTGEVISIGSGTAAVDAGF